MNYYYKNVGSGFGVVSTEVVSIRCSDKSYYFTTKVDTTTVLDFKTSIYFISNNGNIAPHSGTTVAIVITRKDDKSFDATFSGKVWSAKEMDTLFIKDGQMLNVKLPQ